jgi:hypothetical protein
MEKKNDTQLLIEIPEELKKDFKIKCAENEVSMKVVLTRLINNYIKFGVK